MMSFFSNLATIISEISITMDMLVILSLTEFLMLAIIGLVYLFTKNKKLNKAIVKLQTIIKLKIVEKSEFKQISAYLQEQISLSKLQHETLVNCKHQEEHSEKNIEVLSKRLLVLNAELLTLPEYIENDDNYWSGIYERYEMLIPASGENTTLTEPVESLDEIETIDEKMLLSFADEEDRYDAFVVGDSDKNELSGNESIQKNVPEFNIKDTSAEEIARLRDIIGRQYQSIDELKLNISDIEDLSADADNHALNERLALLKNQTNILSSEQEQFNMCINVLEQENLRLSEEILRYQSNAASQENLTSDNIDDSQSTTVKDLVQTNKEQLQCISILEDEIEVLKSRQSHAAGLVQTEDSDNSENLSTYLSAIDKLKFKLSDKDSEIGLLREEYDTLKQKYVLISRKEANE